MLGTLSVTALVTMGQGLGALSGPSVPMTGNLLGVIYEASLPVAGGWLGALSMACTAHSQERVLGVTGADCRWREWRDGFGVVAGGGWWWLGVVSGGALPVVGGRLGTLWGLHCHSERDAGERGVSGAILGYTAGGGGSC